MIDIGYLIGKFTIELIYNIGRILTLLTLDLLILLLFCILFLKIAMPNIWVFRTGEKTIARSKEEFIDWISNFYKPLFMWVRIGE